MSILILYGTTEGQTRKIVDFMRQRLEAAGHLVTLWEATTDTASLNPGGYDAVIVAASVHLGKYQQAVEHWVRGHALELSRVGAAFVSVSLAAAGTDEDDVKGIQQVVAEFMHRTGWTPAVLEHVAGAFRYTEYDFFKRWALKYIAWRKGAPTDTGRDWELTDWDAVGRFVDNYMNHCAAAADRHR